MDTSKKVNFSLQFKAWLKTNAPEIRCFISFTLISLSLLLRNDSLFAIYPQSSTWTFILSNFFLTFAFAALALLSILKAKPIRTTVASIIAFLALISALVFCILAHAFTGSPALLIVVIICASIGKALVLVLISLSLSKLHPQKIVTLIAGSIGLSFTLSFFFGNFIQSHALVFYIALIFLALVIAFPRTKTQEALSKISPTNDFFDFSSGFFSGFSNRLFLIILAFKFAFGFTIASDGAIAIPWQTIILACTAFSILFWYLHTRKKSPGDILFYISGILTILGLFFTFAQTSALNDIAKIIMQIALQIFTITFYSILILIAARNKADAVAVLGQGYMSACMGTTLGEIVSQIPAQINPVFNDIQLLVFAFIATSFIAFVWLGSKKFPFSHVRHTTHSDNVTSLAPQSSATIAQHRTKTSHVFTIDERCTHLASIHKLTEREKEIFIMLARGRNGAFIQAEYHIKQNTVKTHIRHIYQKLNVHNQQELIDLVDSENDTV